MYAYKFSGERMTRVRYAFFTRPIKWTNCQKKKTGWMLTNSWFRVGGGGEQ